MSNSSASSIILTAITNYVCGEEGLPIIEMVKFTHEEHSEYCKQCWRILNVGLDRLSDLSDEDHPDSIMSDMVANAKEANRDAIPDSYTTITSYYGSYQTFNFGAIIPLHSETDYSNAGRTVTNSTTNWDKPN